MRDSWSMARSITLPNFFQDFPMSWSLFEDWPKQASGRWPEEGLQGSKTPCHPSSNPCLLYSPDKELVIQCDASSHDLLVVLLQEGRPLAYASRVLTGPETRYATIEKGTLVTVFALAKMRQFAYGRNVLVNSDHKPLEAIAKKTLQSPCPRQWCQVHSTLQIWCRSFNPVGSREISNEFEVINAVQFLPMWLEKKGQLETSKDETRQLLKATILEGCQEDRSNWLPQPELSPYYDMSDELGVYDGLVFKGELFPSWCLKG